jgi:hypothetical protein
MEKVFEDWKKGTTRADFKAEYPIHLNGVETLAGAARATAKRLNMSAKESEELAKRYKSYPRELSGAGVKPVPPVLFSVSKTSEDHTPEKYKNFVLPAFAAMKPPPKVRLVQFDAGVHSYTSSEPGLPLGLAPAVARLWNDAIMGGYYLDTGAERAVLK